MITRGSYFSPVPFVSTARTTVTQFIGGCLAKFQAPLPYREHDASLCHEFLDSANIEREAAIQSNAVADDFRWEAVFFVIGNRWGCFQETILPGSPPSLAKLTIPLVLLFSCG
jgi:hypothetical protein